MEIKNKKEVAELLRELEDYEDILSELRKGNGSIEYFNSEHNCIFALQEGRFYVLYRLCVHELKEVLKSKIKMIKKNLEKL